MPLQPTRFSRLVETEHHTQLIQAEPAFETGARRPVWSSSWHLLFRVHQPPHRNASDSCLQSWHSARPKPLQRHLLRTRYSVPSRTLVYNVTCWKFAALHDREHWSTIPTSIEFGRPISPNSTGKSGLSTLNSAAIFCTDLKDISIHIFSHTPSQLITKSCSYKSTFTLT